MGDQETPPTSTAILDAAYWRDAFAHPETRPLLTLLLDLPTDLAVEALPVAAAAFPAFPVKTAPLRDGASNTSFASWHREGTHAFSSWSCAAVKRRALTGGGGMGTQVVLYYHNILPEIRRPYALLWRDVREALVPAATGRLDRGDAFAAAALDALDRIVAQQGFRDVTFMLAVQAELAGGDRDRLLALLPRSRAVLTTVDYRLVPGPHAAFWEGYLPQELAHPRDDTFSWGPPDRA